MNYFTLLIRKSVLSKAIFLFAFQIVISSNLIYNIPNHLDGELNSIGFGAPSDYHEVENAFLDSEPLNEAYAPAPVLTCPSTDAAYETNPGECFKSLSFTANAIGLNPSIKYFIDGMEITFPFDFPTGTTAVDVEATDVTGTSTCNFNVEVINNDTPVPVRSCPSNITAYTDPGMCDAVVFFNEPIVNGICESDIVYTYRSGDTFPIGRTRVEFSSPRYGLSCWFRIDVYDDEPPSIICPTPNSGYTTDPGSNMASLSFTAAANNTNCSINSPDIENVSIEYRVNGDPITFPYDFPIGTTNVIVTATESGTWSTGASNTCSFEVNVVDNEPPLVECPEGITTSTDVDSCSSNVSFSATGTDNDGSPTISYAIGGMSITSPYNFPIGTTTVTATATDSSGLTDSCDFDVTIEDHQDPIITSCPSDLTVNTDPNQCTASLSPTASASDNCGSASISYTISETPITFPYDFGIGSTTVNVIASDNSGNTTSCNFEVIVADNQNPVINFCPSDTTVNTDSNECNAALSFNASATDNCDSTNIDYQVSGSSISFPYNFNIGSTIVTVIATDTRGNSTSCDFEVNVNDNEPPLINCPVPAASYNTDNGQCHRTLSLPATATDNCSTSIPISYSVGGSAIAFPYDFPVGSTTVTVNATDDEGNTANCSFDVVIVDNENPIVPVLPNITWGCEYTVGMPTTTDNCSGTLTGTTSDPLTYSTNGTHTVTWRFEDANGNVSTAAQNITIEQIECSTTIVQNVSCNGGNDGIANVSVSGGVAPINIDWNGQNPNALSAGTYTVNVTDANGCTSSCDVTISEPNALTATVTQIQGVLCNGESNGQATVSPVGGNGGYMYAWDNGENTSTATNLNAGLHSVQVTDNKGCTTTATVTITQPNVLGVSLNTKINTSCNGGNDGSIDVNVSGGSPTYSYSWTGPSGFSSSNQDISGLRNGTYSLIVTDNYGCQASYSTTITQPTALSLNITKTDITCNGETDGTATANVSGGTSPYSYSWNTSPLQSGATAFNLPSGTHTVTITDAKGCTINRSITITEPSTLTATGNFTQPSCNGGSNGTASVSASGGTNPYTYQWSVSAGSATTSSVSGLSAGFYTVTVSDARGCSRQVAVVVTQPTAVTGTTSGTLGCAGSNNGTATVTPNGGNPPYSYLWSNGGTTQTITGLSPGSYSVVITDSNGCTSNSLTRTNSNPAPLSISVNGVNTGSIGASNGSANSSTTGGEAPYTYLWSNGATSQNVSGLSAGTYTVTVTDRSGCTATASVNIGDPMSVNLNLSSGCEGIDDIETLYAVPNITGGFAPYSYAWSFGSFSVTPPGNYPGSQTVKYTAAGDKIITLTITDSSGQTRTVSQTYTLDICYEDFTNCSQCGSNDFIIGDFYIGDEFGNPIEDCSGGDTIAIYVWFTTPSSATPKYNLYFIAGYTVFNPITGLNTTDYVEDCLYSGSTPIPVSSQGRLLLDDDFVCGSSITLNNIRYSWKQRANSDCGIDTPKCRCVNTNTVVASPLSAVITLTQVTCNGFANGTASSQAYGGEPPYSYSWNTGSTSQNITGLGPNTYTVTVTDSEGRVATATTTITEPSVLSATASVSSDYNGRDISCFNSADGQALVSVSGGTMPYTYSWSNGQSSNNATGLSEGTYQVLVTDANGCTISSTVSLTDPDDITSSINSTNPLCFGDANGTATVNVTGGGTSPFTYQWSNGQTSSTATGLIANTNYSVTITDVNGCTETNTVRLTQPNPLSLTTSRTNVACNGGSTGTATVNATGGVSPYNYLWSNGQTSQTSTGLSARVYQVTVTDTNGCEEITTVTITQPTSLSASATSSDVSCFGGSDGSVSVIANNGTPGYTYSWNTSPVQTTPTATGLSVGTYTVIVTDRNGCSTTASAYVSQPTQLTASTNQTNVSCFGVNDGSATINVSGGTSNYSYTWNTAPVQTTATAANLTAGIYTVLVEDENGCQISRSYTISQPTDITTPNAGPDQSLSCGVETTTLNANAPSVGTGLWSIVSQPSNGNGSISNNSDKNALFSASVVGNYTLRWTISSGSCAPKTDDVIVSVSRCSTLDFDGIDDNITFRNNYNLNGPFSFGIWLKSNSTTGNIQTILSKRDASNSANGYDLRLVNNTLSFNWNNSSISSPYQINTSRWFHLAITFNGSTYKLFIDGIEVRSINGSAPASNSRDFIVGAMDQTSTSPFNPVNYFNGWLDELRIWNTALTTDQIRFTMNQEIQSNGTAVRGSVVPLDIAGLSWNNLRGYYKMNQASDVAGGNLNGNSASSVQGKLRNITTWQPETAPLPYTSVRNGTWTNRSAANTPWTHGSTVWDYPNSTGVDGTPITWNIAITNHNINSGNKDITLYALLNNAGELTIADPGTAQNENNDGQSLRLTHYLKLDGSVDLLGESQLLQDEGSILAANSGGYIERDQQGFTNPYNYNYYSSPVSILNNSSSNTYYTINDNMKDGSNSNNPQNINFISSPTATGSNNPITLSTRWMYTYENFPENSYASWNRKTPNDYINPGLGFTLKGSGCTTDVQNYVFVGKPNNGTIENFVSIGFQSLVGNPYPSAIDAFEFIKDNLPPSSASANDGSTGSIDGTLYFWETFETNQTHILRDYQGGYSAMNLTGAVTTIISEEISGEGISTKTPGRYIPIAQGFYVTSSNVGGQVRFKNSQRVFQKEGTSSSVFMRTGRPSTNSIGSENLDDTKRIKLNFISAKNNTRQLLIGFTNGLATDEFDYGYDAINIEDRSDDFAWMLEQDKYLIQGVGKFDTDKRYPLGVFTSEEGQIEINVESTENFSKPINIYVYDSLTETHTNIKDDPFTINLEAGDYIDRFEIVFRDNSEKDDEVEELPEPVLEYDFSIRYLDRNNELLIQTPSEMEIRQVYLINIMGQTVKSWNATNSTFSTETRIPINGISEGNYIVKVQTQSDTFTKKIIIKY